MSRRIQTLEQAQRKPALSRGAVVASAKMLRQGTNGRFGEAALQREAPRRTAGKGRQRQRPKVSDFHTLRDRQCIFELDAEIADSAVHLGVTEQELHGPQVASFLVDVRHLCASH